MCWELLLFAHNVSTQSGRFLIITAKMNFVSSEKRQMPCSLLRGIWFVCKSPSKSFYSLPLHRNGYRSLPGGRARCSRCRFLWQQSRWHRCPNDASACPDGGIRERGAPSRRSDPGTQLREGVISCGGCEFFLTIFLWKK